MIYNLVKEHSVLNDYIAQLRDVNIQNNRIVFRENLKRIGQIMAYEISKKLLFKEKEITTPLGISNDFMLKQQPVLGTILRAGLPFHQGFLNMFDKAENAFISTYRKEDNNSHQLQYVVEQCSGPSIQDKILIMTDPMLATGYSMIKSLEVLMNLKGTPLEVHIAVVIASQQGIETVETQYPNTTIWAGVVDPKLNDHQYIIPGIGDVGDLAFGNK